VSLDESAVGAYFIDESGKVWRCISYTDGPSITFEALEPENSAVREIAGGVVGSPFVRSFRRLVSVAE
jgi:hypothetical protein